MHSAFFYQFDPTGAYIYINLLKLSKVFDPPLFKNRNKRNILPTDTNSRGVRTCAGEVAVAGERSMG